MLTYKMHQVHYLSVRWVHVELLEAVTPCPR
jgi:hypothetical protein